MFWRTNKTLFNKILLFIIGLTIWSAQSLAAEQVYLVIDVSGNIQRLDPQKKRITEIKQFINQLPEGTRAGVWTYAGAVNRLVAPGTVNNAWRQNATQSISTIGGYGAKSNVVEALSQATFYWRDNKNIAGRNIVLITDSGVRPTGEQEDNYESKKELITHLLPAMQRSRIRVHVIAFDKANKELYQQLAEQTHGSFQAIHQASDLNHAFKKLRATLALPVNKNPVAIEEKQPESKPVIEEIIVEEIIEQPVEKSKEKEVSEEIVVITETQPMLHYDHPPKPENIVVIEEIEIVTETVVENDVAEKTENTAPEQFEEGAVLITPESTTVLTEETAESLGTDEAEEIRTALANAEAELSDLLNEFAAMPKNDHSTKEPLVITLADGSVLVTSDESKAKELAPENVMQPISTPAESLEIAEAEEEPSSEWVEAQNEGDIWPLILTILVIVNLVVILLLFIGRFFWLRHKRKMAGNKSNHYY